MTMNKTFRLLPIAAGMLVAFGNANAQDSAEVKALITPSSSASAGLGTMNSDQNARKFGQWSGMSKGGAYGLFDIDMVKRDDATGTWTTLKGTDLGLDTRSLSFGQQRQGDWKYSIDYNEITKRDPYTINTGMTGVGTSNPTINLINKPVMSATWATANGMQADNGVVGSDISLKIHRTALGISAAKWFSPEVQFEASARTEQKKGARLFGRAGYQSGDMAFNPTNDVANANGGWALLLTPEPLSSKINIFEGKLSFNRDKLAMTAGYHGSLYINDFGNLSPVVPGTLNRGVLWGNTGVAGSSSLATLASATVALPPDNQAHQLYLTGNYALSTATRMNFKLAYTHATQHESFSGMGLTGAPAGAPADLGGVVNTTLAQGGLSSRVTKDLTLNASLRYEKRDDKTPIAVYGAGSGQLAGSVNNPSASQTRTTAKLDAIYRFLDGYSAVLGGDWERKKTPLPGAHTALFPSQILFREVLDEYGVRAELRKALSATLNGSLGAEYKQRRSDSDWMTAGGANTNYAMRVIDPQYSSAVQPITFMDRNRIKLKASLAWAPTEKLDLQAMLDHNQDNYNRQYVPNITVLAPVAAGTFGNSPIVPGAKDIYSDALTFDGTYGLTDNWKLSGYYTLSLNRWQVNKSDNADDTRNKQHTLGLGAKGKVGGKTDVGADLMYLVDNTGYNNETAAVTTPGWIGQNQYASFLPAIHQTTIRLKMFANYSLDKSSDVRLDLMYQHFRTNDWQWGYNGFPFVYSDNTTVSQNQNQKAAFLAARYLYKF